MHLTSTTACWATNEDFDCAWVYYGYGSRHDMISSCGYWLSLKGILALAEYDYALSKNAGVGLDKRNHEDRILAEKLGLDMEDDWYSIPEDIFESLPLEKQMELSAIRIKHPEGLQKSLQWFEEYKKVVGKIQKSGYQEDHHYIAYRDTDMWTTFEIPSLAKIKEMNPVHYQYHINVEDREKEAMESLCTREKHNEFMDQFRATDDDIEWAMNEALKEMDATHQQMRKDNWYIYGSVQ